MEEALTAGVTTGNGQVPFEALPTEGVPSGNDKTGLRSLRSLLQRYASDAGNFSRTFFQAADRAQTVGAGRGGDDVVRSGRGGWGRRVFECGGKELGRAQRRKRVLESDISWGL